MEPPIGSVIVEPQHPRPFKLPRTAKAAEGEVDADSVAGLLTAGQASRTPIRRPAYRDHPACHPNTIAPKSHNSLTPCRFRD